MTILLILVRLAFSAERGREDQLSNNLEIFSDLETNDDKSQGPFDSKEISENDYVVVKLLYNEHKKNVLLKYFVAQILEVKDNTIEANFLKRKGIAFHFPPIHAKYEVHREAIQQKLKQPVEKKRGYLYFSDDSRFPLNTRSFFTPIDSLFAPNAWVNSEQIKGVKRYT
ncbi:hypothetical protein PGB90_005610 [Kerria lacca]